MLLRVVASLLSRVLVRFDDGDGLSGGDRFRFIGDDDDEWSDVDLLKGSIVWAMLCMSEFEQDVAVMRVYLSESSSCDSNAKRVATSSDHGIGLT